MTEAFTVSIGRAWTGSIGGVFPCYFSALSFVKTPEYCVSLYFRTHVSTSVCDLYIRSPLSELFEEVYSGFQSSA